MQLRRLESDTELVVATAAAGETILCCRKKIRIGRGPRYAIAAAGGPFFFAATKNRIGRGRSSSRQPLQAEPFFLAATKNRIGRGRSSPLRSLQAGHSSLQRRRLESDAEYRCRNNCCRRNHSPLASIRKSGLEIKNRCMKEGVNGEKPTSIPKSGLEIKNRCTKQHIPQHAFITR